MSLGCKWLPVEETVLLSASFLCGADRTHDRHLAKQGLIPLYNVHSLCSLQLASQTEAS